MDLKKKLGAETDEAEINRQIYRNCKRLVETWGSNNFEKQNPSLNSIKEITTLIEYNGL